MDKEQFWSTPKNEAIKWLDIFKGLGEVALEFVTKQFTHEGISSHLPEAQDEPRTIE